MNDTIARGIIARGLSILPVDKKTLIPRFKWKTRENRQKHAMNSWDKADPFFPPNKMTFYAVLTGWQHGVKGHFVRGEKRVCFVP